jgi:PAS domain S-box-containing protein
VSDRAAADTALSASEERFRLLVAGVRDYAIFMLDEHGHVLTWNAGAERIKGYPAAAIIGQHFSLFYPPEALARGLPSHELEVATATGSFEDEGWRVRQDGSLFWANVVITAVRDATGRLLGFSKITRDLTQRRAHEERLRQSEERFRLLVEGVKDHAIFMLDANGHVATWNQGAERIKGYTAAEIVGRHFSVFYPEEARESGWPEHELRMAAETGSFLDEGWRLRKDGSTIWAAVTITALRDSDGRLLGYAKLTRDLTDRKRAEALELANRHHEEALEAERSARMAAQRATRMKDEFLATLSHELRTPLNAIVGWTRVLRDGGAMHPDRLERGLGVIERNALAQTRLIEDLLDLSGILNGKVRLDLMPVDVAGVVRRAVESAEPVAETKAIALDVRLETLPGPVAGNAARLQQVVWNLLSNAIKFTPRGGRVEVRLRPAGTNVELSVSDTGVGIAEHFLPLVFDRFSQRDGSTTRSHGGLGLGLAICKQLVELHGGTIRASSPGEGQGSTFLVELPITTATLSEGAEERAPTGQPVSEDVAAELPRLAGVHVMVIDDEPDARDLIAMLLDEQGAAVSVYGSAPRRSRRCRRNARA